MNKIDPRTDAIAVTAEQWLRWFAEGRLDLPADELPAFRRHFENLIDERHRQRLASLRARWQAAKERA